MVQIDAPEYDSDIDGHKDTPPQLSTHAESNQTEPPTYANNSENTIPPQDPDRIEHLTKQVQDLAEYIKTVSQQQEECRSFDLDSIPELEEDWEDGQFADLDFTDHNNTTKESDLIRKEYSTHFQKHSDEEYNSPHNTMPGFDYYLPEPDYYHSDTWPKQYKRYQNPNIYLPPPPDPRDIERWYGGKGRGRERRLELHSDRLFSEKTRSLESRIAHKHKKNQRQREKKFFNS